MQRIFSTFNSMQINDAFNNAKNSLKFIANDPEYYLNESLIKLRRQIDLERELSKKQIEEHFDKLIQKILIQKILIQKILK